MMTPFTVHQLTQIAWGNLARPHAETSESFIQESQINWTGVDDAIKTRVALAACHKFS